MKNENICLGPIGVIKRGPQLGLPSAADDMSDVVVFEPYLPGLDGIDNFSHVIVLFWMHLLKPEERTTLKVHPRRKPELPLTGVFSTRSPARPNPLGVAIVALMKRQGNVLTVKGLDALQGSPVIDIKPYLPAGDSYPMASVPAWVADYLDNPRTQD